MCRMAWQLAVALAVLGQDSAAQRLTPDEAVELLELGNQRFSTGAPVEKPLGDGARRTLAGGQSPFAIVVTTSDSRVAPEHIFDTGLGELIVIRSAGPAWSPETIASIEFAAQELETPLCVVLGHDRSALLELTKAGQAESPAMARLQERLAPALERARREGLQGEAMLRRAEAENVYQTIADVLSRSPVLRDYVRTHRFRFTGAHYELESGQVEWLPERAIPVHQPRPKPPKARAQTVRGLPPHVAMRMLQTGYRRFIAGVTPPAEATTERRKQLVDGARPLAAIVTCTDSRVVPEHIFSVGLGELEVIRIAGNVWTDDVQASLEYAVEHRGVSLIVVLGHDGCNTIAAGLHTDSHRVSESMRQLLARIEPAVSAARAELGDHAEHSQLLARGAEWNALRFIRQLRTQSPLLSDHERQGLIGVLGAVYALDSGDIRWLSERSDAEANPAPLGETVSHEAEANAESHAEPEHGHEPQPATPPAYQPSARVTRIANSTHSTVTQPEPWFGTLMIALLVASGGVMLLLLLQRRSAHEELEELATPE